MGEILVLAEHRRGELRDITFEMLSMANKCADENGLSVTTLFLGHDASDLSSGLKNASEKIICMEDPELENYSPEPYLAALEMVIKDRKPMLTLIGHTAEGMDLAPVLATRLSIPLATDCAEISLVEGRLEVVRQIYGGKINAHLIMKPCDQYLISVRQGSAASEPQQGKSGDMETISHPSWKSPAQRSFIEYLEAALEDVDISAADVLVSIGRGIGKPENISVAQDFADAIGATLSCSRPVADKEWLPKSRQVGTSGKTVRPKVYIALGISGAFQHQAGMKNSDTIIAVNKDPRAPIFNIAHYGIVEDMFKVLPLLTEKFS